MKDTEHPPTLAEICQWPATVDVEMACKALGISKSHGYELIKRGEYPARVIHVGSRRRVVTAALIALLTVDIAA